jgi:hypothetical protein
MDRFITIAGLTLSAVWLLVLAAVSIVQRF